jgi:hypothetical protein
MNEEKNDMARGALLILIFALAAALLYGISRPAPTAPMPATFTPVLFRPTPTPAAEAAVSVGLSVTMFYPVSTEMGIAPTITPPPVLTATPLVLLPSNVNGVPLDEIIVISPAVADHIRAIYALGQTMHRDPRAFSKIGDSTIENPHFLARFDSTDYNLGNWAGLQRVIDYYHGSFGRQGEAVRRGLHSWSALDPLWANPQDCQPQETVVMCEFRSHNPAIVFIRLGSNDRGVPEGFEKNMRKIIDLALVNGIVPIIGTKADRFEGPDGINNVILRKLAEEYELPLWDFDKVASATPGHGLDQDGVHLSAFYAHDYTQALAYQRGHGIHNLTALIALDAVWQVIETSDK